ncbi:MAG: lactate utilization protein [Anaerotignaceae bacterium]
MATPKEIRNEMLAARIIKGLQKRNMEGFFCKTNEEAIAKALELVKENSSITWGGSMTIRDMGLTKALMEGNYDVFDRDTATPEEVQIGMRKAFSMDWFLTGANAITEDGEIVNIDGLGNRVAAITFGPKQVLFVIGLNKVTQDLDSAIKRARSTAAPINAARFDIKTPCRVDGVCHNCNSPDTICCSFHVLRHSKINDRVKVILIENELGY